MLERFWGWDRNKQMGLKNQTRSFFPASHVHSHPVPAAGKSFKCDLVKSNHFISQMRKLSPRKAKECVQWDTTEFCFYFWWNHAMICQRDVWSHKSWETKSQTVFKIGVSLTMIPFFFFFRHVLFWITMLASKLSSAAGRNINHVSYRSVLSNAVAISRMRLFKFKLIKIKVKI